MEKVHCTAFDRIYSDYLAMTNDAQKQPPRGVLRKRCFENIQQIYRRTPMPKCDFNKVTLLKSHFGMGVLL